MIMRIVILLAAIVCYSCNNSGTVLKENKSNQLPYYNSASFMPQWLQSNNSNSLQAIHTIGSFNFTDQEGNGFSDKNVAGKIYVADFFFTSCPGICKTLTTNLLEVQKTFTGDSNLVILSHSVTPDIDSVPVLKQYATNFHINNKQWHLLTGSKNAIYTLARQSYFADEDLGMKKDVNDFLHTENILLIDKHQHIRGVYKGTSLLEIKDLIADIKILQQEE